FGQDFVQRFEQALAFFWLQRLERRVGRKLGAMKNVVGVAAADTRDRALVAQDRVNAPAVGALAYPLCELVARCFRTQSNEWTLVAFGDDPPSGLALSAVLAHEHCAIAGEVPPRHRTLGLRLLRRFFEIDAARLR